MSVNGFNLPKSNPQPKCDYVPRGHCWSKKRRNSKDQNLSPVCIRCRKSNWSCILMVNPVNLLIPPFTMQEPMDPVIGKILNHKIDRELHKNLPPRWQWQTCTNPNHLWTNNKCLENRITLIPWILKLFIIPKNHNNYPIIRLNFEKQHILQFQDQSQIN